MREELGEAGRTVLLLGIAADQAELRIIVDPIDGTRGLGSCRCRAQSRFTK